MTRWQRYRMLLAIITPVVIASTWLTHSNDLSLGQMLVAWMFLIIFYLFIAPPLAAWAEWDLQMRKKDSKYGPEDFQLFIKDFTNSKEK